MRCGVNSCANSIFSLLIAQLVDASHPYYTNSIVERVGSRSCNAGKRVRSFPSSFPSSLIRRPTTTRMKAKAMRDGDITIIIAKTTTTITIIIIIIITTRQYIHAHI